MLQFAQYRGEFRGPQVVLWGSPLGVPEPPLQQSVPPPDKVASQSLAAKQLDTPIDARGDKLLVARSVMPVIKRHGGAKYDADVELDNPQTQASEGLRQPSRVVTRMKHTLTELCRIVAVALGCAISGAGVGFVQGGIVARGADKMYQVTFAGGAAMIGGAIAFSWDQFSFTG